MKKLLFSAAIIAMGTGIVFAQQKTQAKKHRPGTSRVEMRKTQQPKLTPEEAAQIRVERLDKAVTLTDQQKVDIKNIYLADIQKNRERMTERRKANQKVKALLTPDQVQKMETSNAQMTRDVRIERNNRNLKH